MSAVGKAQPCRNVFYGGLRRREHRLCKAYLYCEIILIRRFAEFALEYRRKHRYRQPEMLCKFVHVEFVAKVRYDVFFVLIARESRFVFA